MLVKATRKGYYGDRVREVGVTFNYKPNDEKAFKAGKENLPSWMKLVEINKNIDPNKTRNDKLENLSNDVESARESLKAAEAAAGEADDALNAATKKADKEVAADAANAANEAVDVATQALSDAEDALAAAESE